MVDHDHASVWKIAHGLMPFSPGLDEFNADWLSSMKLRLKGGKQARQAQHSDALQSGRPGKISVLGQ